MRKSKCACAFILVLILFLLCACNSESSQKSNSEYPPSVSVNENQIFLYDPFSYSLGIYDLDLMKWTPIEAQNALFQSFDWGNYYPYYVVGQHNKLLFKAGKVEDSSLDFHFSLKNKAEALAPFATDGETFLYMIERITENDYFKSVVTISDDGKAELVVNLDGMPVMDGVIAGDYLYFTCPIENSDLYEVWKLNLTEKTIGQKPVLVRNDYNTFKIFQYKGQVLYLNIDEKHLYNNEVKINLSQEADEIMVDNEAGFVAEKYVTDSGHLEITFTDILSGKILGTYKNAINFTRDGTVITIYGQGFIEKLDLGKTE